MDAPIGVLWVLCSQPKNLGNSPSSEASANDRLQPIAQVTPFEKKVKALAQYKSYIGNVTESIIARSKYKGGIIGVDHAESFQVIKQLEL